MLVRTYYQFPTIISTRIQLSICRLLILPVELLEQSGKLDKELLYFEMARAIICKIDTLLPIFEHFLTLQFYKAQKEDVKCQLIWPGLENLVKANWQEMDEFGFIKKSDKNEDCSNVQNFLPKVFYVSISNGLYGMTFRASLEDLGYISRSGSSGN